jgi:C4-type Zn-finger protein
MSQNRQPEQQQQASLLKCPSCQQPMRLVGRENKAGSRADLLTFECDCGQIFATTTDQ